MTKNGNDRVRNFGLLKIEEYDTISHRVGASPGEAISVLQTGGIWKPAAAADYSHLILDWN